MLLEQQIDITGNSVTDTNGNTYIARGPIAKYNNAGQQLWTVSSSISTGVFQNIALNPSGGIIVIGTALYNDDTYGIISRYDENGICLWTKMGEFPRGPQRVKCDSNGNSYVTGSGYVDSTTGNSGFLVKYDNNGNLLYNKTVLHWPNEMALDGQNNIYITGWFATGYPGGLQCGRITKRISMKINIINIITIGS